MIRRVGLFYEKNTDISFNGKVAGSSKGRILKGQKVDDFETYDDTGELEEVTSPTVHLERISYILVLVTQGEGRPDFLYL